MTTRPAADAVPSTKPERPVLDTSNLARRIRSVASLAEGEGGDDERSANRNPTAQCPWELDLQRGHLTSPQGVPILLSGREAILVEHFARAARATVPRHAIDALLGNSSSDPESRRLDAALRRLRMKARAAGTDLPLHVVHAMGLRFTGVLDVV